MTRDEFIRAIALLKTAYPREQSLQTKESMEFWYRMLGDISYERFNTFVAKWSCTQKWMPTIAEVREGCAELSEEAIPDWGAGWNEVTTAIGKYGYMRGDEAMRSFSPVTKEVVRRLGWQNLCESENPAADRSQFRNIYEICSKRKQEDRQLPEALKQQIQSFLPGGSMLMLEQFAEVDT